MKYLLITLSLFCCCSHSFGQSSSDSTNEVVPLEYDSKMLRTIILKTSINDSIESRMIFDTGWSGIFVPKKFLDKQVLDNMTDGKEAVNAPIKVSVGEQWEHTYSERWTAAFDSTHILSRIYGSDISIADWKIFEGKVIEVSFGDKYLKELTNFNPDTYLALGYDSILSLVKEDVRLHFQVCWARLCWRTISLL